MRRPAALLLLFALLSATASGGHAEPDATLRGLILDPEGHPVPNATVSAFVDASHVYDARSDAEGGYVIDVTPGRVALSARTDPRDPWRAVTVAGLDCERDECPVVAAGEEAWRNLTLPWAGFLEGNVTLPDGTPARNATVSAQHASSLVLEGVLSVQADEAGHYRLALEPGPARLGGAPSVEDAERALPAGRACDAGNESTCVLVPERGVAWVDLVLAEPVLARGVVEVPEGAAREHLLVVLTSDAFTNGTSTDAAGAWSMRVAPGEYALRVEPRDGNAARYVRACPPACVVAEAGATTWANATLAQAYAVSGRFLAPDSVRGDLVVRFHRDGAFQEASSVQVGAYFEVRVPAGAYEVELARQPDEGGLETLATACCLTVAGATEADVVVLPNGTLLLRTPQPAPPSADSPAQTAPPRVRETPAAPLVPALVAAALLLRRR